jgi:uncharacterized integral membrane protein
MKISTNKPPNIATRLRFGRSFVVAMGIVITVVMIVCATTNTAIIFCSVSLNYLNSKMSFCRQVLVFMWFMSYTLEVGKVMVKNRRF